MSHFSLQLKPHFSDSKPMHLKLKHFVLTITHHLVVKRTSVNLNHDCTLINSCFYSLHWAFVASMSAKHFRVVHRGEATAAASGGGAPARQDNGALSFCQKGKKDRVWET